MNIRTLLISISTLTLPMVLAAKLFELRDTSLDSAEFKARVTAAYGVNSEIEPKLTSADRDFLNKILPHLQNNLQEAIRLVEEEVDGESNVAFDFMLGNLYYQTEQLSKAENALKRAIKKMPDFRRAHRIIALVYTRQDRKTEVIESLRKVITLGGGDAQSYGLLAYMLYSEEQFESALQAYQLARMFKPDSEDLKRGLAQCLLMTGQNKRAIMLFDELILENPKETDYWLLQANSYLAEDLNEEAVANLVSATAVGEVSVQTWYLLGNLYLNMGLVSQALESYVQILDDPSTLDSKTAFQPLDNFLKRSEYSAAKTYFSSLESKLPKQTLEELGEQLIFARANLKIADGELQEVIGILEPYAIDNPLNGEVLMLLARALSGTGNNEKAMFYFERAELLSDYTVEALIEMARLKVNERDLEAALKHLRTAQSIDPRSHIQRYTEQVEKALKR